MIVHEAVAAGSLPKGAEVQVYVESPQDPEVRVLLRSAAECAIERAGFTCVRDSETVVVVDATIKKEVATDSTRPSQTFHAQGPPILRFAVRLAAYPFSPTTGVPEKERVYWSVEASITGAMDKSEDVAALTYVLSDYIDRTLTYELDAQVDFKADSELESFKEQLAARTNE